MKPELSCIFLTRRCHMHCGYCAIRSSPLSGPELSSTQWIEVFKLLQDLGIVFNLILGNEPLTLRQGLVEIIKNMPSTDYALYTSAPEKLFEGLRRDLKEAGLRNLSCGYDLPPNIAKNRYTDQARKSLNAHEALKWAKREGISDYQGTATINATNFHHLPDVIRSLDELGVWAGFNFIHWAKDDLYDFFPREARMRTYRIPLFGYRALSNTFVEVASLIEQGAMVQLPLQYLEDFFTYGGTLSWHCSEPILSVDANGQMRTCGYRKGDRVASYSIFDLKNKYDAFLNDWYKDMKECPGCYWSYPWLNEYWLERDMDHGREVFKVHASKTAEVK